MAGIGELDTKQYSGTIPVNSLGDKFLGYGTQLQEQARLDAAEKARLEQQKFENTLKIAAEDRAKAQADMQKDEYLQGKAEKTATGEAMRALLNPEQYKAQKMAGEEAAIQASLANLSPAERAATEKVLATQYDKGASSKGWLDTALNSANADQSKILGTKASQLALALQDPTSAEYIANRDAQRADTLWKLEQETKFKNAQDKFRIGLENEASGKDEYTGVMRKLDAIAATRPVVDEKEQKTYEYVLKGADAKVDMFDKRIKAVQDSGKEVPSALVNLFTEAKKERDSIVKPSTKEVPLTESEYVKEVAKVLASSGITNPKARESILKTADAQKSLLYPKTEGFTPAQLYSIQQDQKKELNAEKSALSLGESVWGKDGLKKKLESNPNMTPETITKLAQIDIDKRKDYKAGSIVADISKLITDGDTNSYGNVANKKDVLEKILKERFDGKKADMVQAIKGYYDVQGTGFHKNWLGGSPIGDALDNFIAAQGY